MSKVGIAGIILVLLLISGISSFVFSHMEITPVFVKDSVTGQSMLSGQIIGTDENGNQVTLETYSGKPISLLTLGVNGIKNYFIFGSNGKGYFQGWGYHSGINSTSQWIFRP